MLVSDFYETPETQDIQRLYTCGLRQKRDVMKKMGLGVSSRHSLVSVNPRDNHSIAPVSLRNTNLPLALKQSYKLFHAKVS